MGLRVVCGWGIIHNKGGRGANNEANARKEILFAKVSRMGIKGERL